MTRTLFDHLSAELLALDTALDDLDDSSQLETIAAYLETLTTDRDHKLDGYATLISELDARATARMTEAQRLTALARTDENKAQRLKERLKLFFEVHGLERVNTARYRLSIAKNGGKTPIFLSVEPEQLPPAYQRTRIEADLEAIRTTLGTGEKLVFAQLIERGTSLRIK